MSCLNDIFRSIEYIHNNITKNITIDECSKVSALSKPYYSTMFSMYSYITHPQYITGGGVTYLRIMKIFKSH